MFTLTSVKFRIQNLQSTNFTVAIEILVPLSGPLFFYCLSSHRTMTGLFLLAANILFGSQLLHITLVDLDAYENKMAFAARSRSFVLTDNLSQQTESYRHIPDRAGTLDLLQTSIFSLLNSVNYSLGSVNRSRLFFYYTVQFCSFKRTFFTLRFS